MHVRVSSLRLFIHCADAHSVLTALSADKRVDSPGSAVRNMFDFDRNPSMCM